MTNVEVTSTYDCDEGYETTRLQFVLRKSVLIMIDASCKFVN